MTPPILVGHRGIGNPWCAVLNIGEQSIPAITYAATHHADIVEGDVQRSSDGTMFMMHDTGPKGLERTTNGTGDPVKRPWTYTSKLKLEIVGIDNNGNGDPDNLPYGPPTFRSWLAAAKATGKTVFVELKNGPEWSAAEIREDYWAEVKRQGMTNRVITGASESDIATLKSAGARKLSWGVQHHASANRIKGVVGAGGYVTTRLTEAEAHPDWLKSLKAADIKVFLWTLTREAHYARALPFGVYGWFCNNTDDAWTWLQEHAA